MLEIADPRIRFYHHINDPQAQSIDENYSAALDLSSFNLIHIRYVFKCFCSNTLNFSIFIDEYPRQVSQEQIPEN